MSDYPATRTMPPKPASAGIDLKTLWITAVSSAAAAYACSKLWAPGTLAAAAFTPVLVAILREGLAKSTDVVTRVVPVKGVVRSAKPEGPRALDSAGPPAGAWSAADLIAELPEDVDDPAVRVAQPGEIAYHGSGARSRHWRIAIVTGLLGFLIAAVVFTVPELVAGGSAAGEGRGTTIFGGGKQHDGKTPAGTTTTTTAPAKTVTAPPRSTVTVPQETVTTPPPAVTTPQTSPGEATPVPTTTTAPPPVPEPPPAGVPPG